MRYAGRVALVTGAGSGVGMATAVRLAADGALVACVDLRPNGTGERLGPAGLDLEADVTDEASVRAAVAAVVGWAGRLDVVVNAAGVASFGHTADVERQEWQRVLEVNLTGPFLVTREALPHLVGSGGAVVNVASLAGVRGWRYSAAYSASKGGLVALTRSLAVEYAKTGVRFTCVCPGSVDTPLRASIRPVPDADPDLLAHGRALVDPPVSDPEEIAAAIAFLGSKEARFATGAVLRMDGGAGA
jgi:meso-butanediol dehydrogenase / (S,S)-butanediol dehydrogenase / diacetyl reductase